MQKQTIKIRMKMGSRTINENGHCYGTMKFNLRKHNRKGKSILIAQWMHYRDMVEIDENRIARYEALCHTTACIEVYNYKFKRDY